jgi:hypothetical protein
LHHRAHQRIESVDLALLVIVRTQQIAGYMLHFLGEQRRAVDFDQTQYAMGGMQLVGALLEQRPLVRAFGIGLERRARVVQRRRKFFGNDVQGLGADVGHTGIVWVRQPPNPLALRVFPVLPALLPGSPALVPGAAPVAAVPPPEPPVELAGSFKAGKRADEAAPSVVVPPP